MLRPVSNSRFVITMGSLKKDLMDRDFVAIVKRYWYFPDSATTPASYLFCSIIPQVEILPPNYPVEGLRRTSNC